MVDSRCQSFARIVEKLHRNQSSRKKNISRNNYRWADNCHFPNSKIIYLQID